MHVPRLPSRSLLKLGLAYRLSLGSWVFTKQNLILSGYKCLFYLIIRFRFAKAYSVFHFVRFIYGLALGIM
jgi:hypothetical protein